MHDMVECANCRNLIGHREPMFRVVSDGKEKFYHMSCYLALFIKEDDDLQKELDLVAERGTD